MMRLQWNRLFKMLALIIVTSVFAGVVLQSFARSGFDYRSIDFYRRDGSFCPEVWHGEEETASHHDCVEEVIQRRRWKGERCDSCPDCWRREDAQFS
jgi:hypothetical protein